MKLIVCLDDRGGMAFGGRRLSRDRLVCQRILEMAKGSVLHMDEKSRSLFPTDAANLLVSSAFLSQAQSGDYCFVEFADVLPYMPAAEEIVVFRWNRKYPADLYFPVHLLDSGFKRSAISEFQGSSHERITQEVFAR